jgi:predicted nucleotidyltransferase
MRLLRERGLERLVQREALRGAVRARLRQILPHFFPGSAVWLFGSVTVAGTFHRKSDIDLAGEELPAPKAFGTRSLTHYGLIAILEEEIGQPVDLILLPETRFRDKILATGEKWIV